ncbi:MAG TPA: hypothetical protein PL188_02400 [Candidatus Cloacimonadota bacterium]|nr:hypothetical protein [Candidatus Cloacimonadota bacterium]
MIYQLFLPINESFKLDLVQSGFYIVMLGLSAWSIYSLRKHANETSWEENWTNHTSATIDDDIGAEHGSVVELCQVVATKPEHLADILPGIMITLGLLGTFFGLAQSLGQAAQTISSSMNQISSSSSSFGSMENALTGMIGMLQGMGTQFKTSIWGIIWFLLLRYFYGRLGYASKRLKWTISKMRVEHQTKQDCDDRFMTSLFDRLINKLEENSKSHRESLNSHYTSFSGNIDKHIQDVVRMIGDQNQASITAQNSCFVELQHALTSHSGEQFGSLQRTLADDNKTLSQAIRENSATVIKTTEVLNIALEKQTSSIANAVEAQSKISISSRQDALNDLRQSLIDNTAEQFEKLQTAMTSDSERLTKALLDNTAAVIDSSNGQKSEIITQAESLFNIIDTQTNRTAGQFEKLQTAMTSDSEKLTKAILDNTAAVIDSSNDQKSALLSQTIGIMEKMDSQNSKLITFSNKCFDQFAILINLADSTAGNTKQFTTTIKTFTADIQGSIDKITVAAGMVQSSAGNLAEVVSNLDTKIGSILGDMSSSITDTISKMNNSFNDNIVKTEAALTSSAKGIANEVQNMSKELGSKITTFDQTMKTATDRLSTTINNMQDNIKEVLGSIKTELSITVKEMNDGFSENLRKNSEALNKSVNNIATAVETMSGTMDIKLNEFSQMTSSSTDKLKETITMMRDNINAILNSLNQDISSTINSMNTLIDKSTKSLEQSVNGISTAASTMESQIKKSFEEFNQSMGTLVKRQDDSLKQFDSSMNIVSENITEVTGEFKKLKDKLETSLSTVSSSNRDLKSSLEIMKVIHEEYKELIISLDTAVKKLSNSLSVVATKIQPLIDGNEYKSIPSHKHLVEDQV